VFLFDSETAFSVFKVQKFLKCAFFQHITQFQSRKFYLIRKQQCHFLQQFLKFQQFQFLHKLQKCEQFPHKLFITLNEQFSQLSRKHDRETRPGNAEGKLLHGTPHSAFDAGKPCRPRTKPKQASKLALRRYHAPQSPQRLTGRPWWRSRTAGKGIARNETARKQNTSASAFQAKGDLRLACRYFRGLVSDGASSSALRPRIAKAVRQLHGFRILAAPLPSPGAQDTPDTGSPVPRRRASSIRAGICRRLLPSALPLRPRSPSTVTEEAQRFRFAEPSESSVSRKLCACRANPESASLPAPRQPAAETAHPPSTLADHQRTPPEGHQGDQPSSRSLP
jgi:hypothetical protein